MSSDNNPQLISINPIIPVDNMEETIRYYEEKLGFKKVYDSTAYQSGSIDYAVLCRDSICFHLQLFENTKGFTTPQFRLRVKNLLALFKEYENKGVATKKKLRDTPWGNREFAFFDLNMVGLTFCESL